MGLDATLCKYKKSNISLIDREYYVDWCEDYYCYVLKEDDDKWRKFETDVFYTSDRMLNSIILDSIKETTGDHYSEEGASLFNLNSLNLAIAKLEKAIKDGVYDNYEILIKKTYEDERAKLLELLNKESSDLVSGEYSYLYHATY